MLEPDSSSPIEGLLAIMRTLRSEQGCPWDREQTLESLRPYLIEEAYEVLDAIESGDRAQLADELGDVLLQVVFQAQLCSEEGAFTFDDVARVISEKLVRRHPHVFGDTAVRDAEDVVRNWHRIKQTERGDPGPEPVSALDGVPRHLPALMRAAQVQRKAVLAEIRQALAAGDPEHARSELGDLMFAAANLGRFLDGTPEEVLHEATARFVRRFHGVEALARADDRDLSSCSLDELEAYWTRVKAAL